MCCVVREWRAKSVLCENEESKGKGIGRGKLVMRCKKNEMREREEYMCAQLKMNL